MSTSPQAEMTALMQLFQLQMQQAAGNRPRIGNTATRNSEKIDGKLWSYDVRQQNARRAWKPVCSRQRQ
jgi:hypothetical protein